jgi:hypothetical protein
MSKSENRIEKGEDNRGGMSVHSGGAYESPPAGAAGLKVADSNKLAILERGILPTLVDGAGKIYAGYATSS